MTRLPYSPIRPRGAGKVHAITMGDTFRTACNRPCRGWIVATTDLLECLRCQDVISGNVPKP